MRGLEDINVKLNSLKWIIGTRIRIPFVNQTNRLEDSLVFMFF